MDAFRELFAYRMEKALENKDLLKMRRHFARKMREM
jgi:hypothetical protein